MTDEPSPGLPPPPAEAIDQALALLLKTMEQGQPGDERGEDTDSKMTHLDRLAWRHEVAGDALQMAARKRATLLRRQRNALIPINQLPSELLSAILVESYNDDLSLDRLQELAQVTWKWWQTIKSDPRFWMDVTPPMKGVEMRIRRAGVLPLRLDWPVDVDGQDQDAFKDLLQRHAERWTDIDLKDYGEDAGLQALCTSYFPRLKYLTVPPSSESLTMSDSNWRLNLAQCQNLQEVRLPIMPYLPVNPSSNSPINLQTLHLDLRFVDSWSLHDLESVLRLTPQLVDLKLEHLFTDTNPPTPVNAPIIGLPNLRRLEFNNVLATGEPQDWIPLLAQIRAPRLEKLDLFYDSEHFGRWFLSIGGRVIFTVLATWPSASMDRPEDAPLYSVLRNAGPSATWRVDCCDDNIVVKAEGSGPGQLYITLDDRPLSSDELAVNILTNLAPLGLPVILRVSCWYGEPDGLEFWDEVLDATPSLRTFTMRGSLEAARQVMNHLSTKAPSSSSANPRAPHLEKFSLRLDDIPDGMRLWIWSEDDAGGAVKTMLDKRREIFIQGGVDPPKLVVTGPNGLVFDEAGSRWLDSESSDAQRGS